MTVVCGPVPTATGAPLALAGRCVVTRGVPATLPNTGAAPVAAAPVDTGALTAGGGELDTVPGGGLDLTGGGPLPGPPVETVVFTGPADTDTCAEGPAEADAFTGPVAGVDAFTDTDADGAPFPATGALNVALVCTLVLPTLTPAEAETPGAADLVDTVVCAPAEPAGVLACADTVAEPCEPEAET
jgi:hypothetical protein